MKESPLAHLITTSGLRSATAASRCQRLLLPVRYRPPGHKDMFTVADRKWMAGVVRTCPSRRGRVAILGPCQQRHRRESRLYLDWGGRGATARLMHITFLARSCAACVTENICVSVCLCVGARHPLSDLEKAARTNQKICGSWTPLGTVEITFFSSLSPCVAATRMHNYSAREQKRASGLKNNLP